MSTPLTPAAQALLDRMIPTHAGAHEEKCPDCQSVIGEERDDLRQALLRIQVEARAIAEALLEYARHDCDCPAAEWSGTKPECTCGYEQALAAPPAEPRE